MSDLKCRVTDCDRTPTHRCPTAFSGEAVECTHHIKQMHVTDRELFSSFDSYLLTPEPYFTSTFTVEITEENTMSETVELTAENIVLVRDPNPILTVEDLKTVKVGEYLVREQSGDLLRVTTAASTPYDNYWILRGNTGYGDYNYSLADMVTSWSKYRRLPAGDPRIVAAEVARATSKMNAEIEKFKEKVVSVAKDYGKRHDMCSVLAEALEELGLEITNRRRVTVELSVDVPWGQDADSDYINQAFRSGDYSIISDDEDDE